MDPRTGRFLSMDPFRGVDRRPLTLHAYLYAGNDPVNVVDPTGAFGEFSVAGMTAITSMMSTLNAVAVPSGAAAQGFVTQVLPLPAERERRQLAGAVFAETLQLNFNEKQAITTTFSNRAFFATICAGRRNYNQNFGDGTIWSAIQNGSTAVNNQRWNLVFSGDDLRPRHVLQQNLPSVWNRSELNQSIRAAEYTSIGMIMEGITDLGGRHPIAFNQAADAPPNSDRMEKIGALGAHTFYGFRLWRGCE
jgi:hypothetical protein